MKILLDANLSWRLAKLLEDYCSSVVHVESTELPVPAKDNEIWEYAKLNGYIIATNDEDFLNLVVSKGFPPKIILFKTGNQSTKALAELFLRHKKNIESLHESEQIGVLEIY